MNFFRSVFSDDPDPPPSSSTSAAATNDSASPPTPTTTTTWSLGGLITTVAARSESVISTVRRDLEEFGSGLKKETETLTRAVAYLDLPAVVSINSIGKIAESLLVSSDRDADYSSSSDSGAVRDDGDVRVSRFERKLRVIQGDVRVYVEEPEEEEAEEYGRWNLGFNLGEKREEIQGLMREGEVVGGIYRKLVVGSEGSVDHETFWCRYFYRVERLRQAEFVRARLVKRAMRDEEDEEELSWDVEGDDDEEEKKGQETNASSAVVDNVKMGNVEFVYADVVKGEETNAPSDVNNANNSNNLLTEVKEVSEVDQSDGDGAEVVVLNEKAGLEVSEKVINDEISKGLVGEVAIEEKHEDDRRSAAKDGDVAVVSKDSKQSALDEEDLGWDEIEDVGSEDEKKVSVKPSGSHDGTELWKRQSAADEVEDLSWDIEDDDDEPVKA
ncbi:hypothetical protein Droror1_Dr00007901 [Drosera rotundifolia]